MKKLVVVGVVCFAIGLLLGVGIAYKLLNKEPKEVVFQLWENTDMSAA